MMCAKPVTLTGKKNPVPCGRCQNCRVNRRQFWVGRIILEMKSSALPSFFVTLTYKPEECPFVLDELGQRWDTLEPLHTKEWLWRWRKRYGPIRYFLVGEYGDRTQRPHYHAVLFGEGVDDVERRVRTTWTAGFSSVFEMNLARARYVSQYTVKKLTRQHGALGPRYPEFARMSKFPPLGTRWIRNEFVPSLLTEAGSRFILERGGIVPTSYRYEERSYPLGRYFRQMVSEETGYEYKKAQEEDLPDDWEERLEHAQALEAKAQRRGAQKGSL